jgi:hypothetical protein
LLGLTLNAEDRDVTRFDPAARAVRPDAAGGDGTLAL